MSNPDSPKSETQRPEAQGPLPLYSNCESGVILSQCNTSKQIRKKEMKFMCNFYQFFFSFMTKEIQNFPTNNLKYFFLETSESH